jgi:hypothetical protein
MDSLWTARPSHCNAQRMPGNIILCPLFRAPEVEFHIRHMASLHSVHDTPQLRKQLMNAWPALREPHSRETCALVRLRLHRHLCNYLPFVDPLQGFLEDV